MTTATATPSLTERFERVNCTRCGGSGRYSYCAAYGTTCFKCNGKGAVLSARGRAANDYCAALRSLPASQLQPGQQVQVDVVSGAGVGVAWAAVESVAPEGDAGRLCVETSRMTYCSVEPERMFRVRQTAEQSAATLAQALAYQATLTKSGTPRV